MDEKQKFRLIVSEVLQIEEDQVTDYLSPEQVDTWDSLNHINLIGVLEQEFGLTLATENLERSQSIPGLKALLAEHGIHV